MKLAKYICDLLYKNEKVIVPGLGCFVSKNIASTYKNSDQSFQPPQKSIEFDELRKLDDGLLANHIAKSEGIPLRDAKDAIRDFVRECIRDLNDGKRIKLMNIGLLSLDKDGKTKFDPENSVNFRADTYGMTKVRSPEIKRKTTEVKKPVEKTVTEPKKAAEQKTTNNVRSKTETAKPPPPPKQYTGKTVLEKAEPSKEKKRNRVTAWGWIGIIIALIVIFCGTIYIVNPEFAKGVYNKYSDIIFQSQQGEDPGDDIADTTAVEGSTDSTLVPEEMTGNTEAELPDTDDNNQEVTPASSSKFYLISGSFKIYDNAINQSKLYSSKGYNTRIIEKDGHYLVSIKEFNTEDEAIQDKGSLKMNENINTWVYQKK